jgi:hypothetical protein
VTGNATAATGTDRMCGGAGDDAPPGDNLAPQGTTATAERDFETDFEI